LTAWLEKFNGNGKNTKGSNCLKPFVVIIDGFVSNPLFALNVDSTILSLNSDFPW
jgi:hypothetical protein